VTIWLENTDFESAAASSTFQKLAKEGILLTQYNAVTHPSEPNYVAAMVGDFFGMADDDNWFLPYNVSTIVDVLEGKNISWASYQENSPADAWSLDYKQTNYISGNGSYTYYKRKHNPHIIANSIAGIPERALRVRNFNDFAVDVNASALPQHVWITPNMVNDAHDTDVTFVSAWLEYFLVPLLKNPLFNNNRTLIQLTFDETETYDIQNTVYTVLLGGAVPESLRGTNDSTFYTHYSILSSVQNNWDLPSLGRQDTNKTVAAVWEFQANQTNYVNDAPADAVNQPLLNLTGIYPGALNPELWTPIPSPDTNAQGAGEKTVFYNTSATNLEVTAAAIAAVAPLNFTELGIKNELNINPNFTYDYELIVNKTNKPSAAATTSGVAPSAKANGSGGSRAVVAVTASVVGAVAGVALIF
jgi:hypothetical protein